MEATSRVFLLVVPPDRRATPSTQDNVSTSGVQEPLKQAEYDFSLWTKPVEKMF